MMVSWRPALQRILGVRLAHGAGVDAEVAADVDIVMLAVAGRRAARIHHSYRIQRRRCGTPGIEASEALEVQRVCPQPSQKRQLGAGGDLAETWHGLAWVSAGESLVTAPVLAAASAQMNLVAVPRSHQSLGQ